MEANWQKKETEGISYDGWNEKQSIAELYPTASTQHHFVHYEGNQSEQIRAPAGFGHPTENPNVHIHNFLAECDTIIVADLEYASTNKSNHIKSENPR